MLELESPTPITPPPGDPAPRGGVLATVPPQLLILALALGVWWGLVFSTVVLCVLEVVPVPPIAINVVVSFYALGHTVRCLQHVYDQAAHCSHHAPRDEPGLVTRSVAATQRRVWAGFAFLPDARAAGAGTIPLPAGPRLLPSPARLSLFQ